MDIRFVMIYRTTWADEIKHWFNRIETATKELEATKEDMEDYSDKWEQVNEAYHWWLIRMDQQLDSFSTPSANELHELVYEAFHIGRHNGLYWNKVSKLIYEWFVEVYGTHIN